MTTIQYRPLSYICEQGSEGHNLHVLVSGSVRVTRSERGLKNSIVERDVGTMGPGAYFGEVAMLDKKGMRTHNIISIDAVTTYSLSRENFDKVNFTWVHLGQPSAYRSNWKKNYLFESSFFY